jgi:hypothetical protein
MNTISRHAARVVDVYAGLPHIARMDSSQEEYGVNHQEIVENGFQIATVDKGLFSQSKVNLTPEIGVDFICLARGPGQQVWIEDMILMKKLSMPLLLGHKDCIKTTNTMISLALLIRSMRFTSRSIGYGYGVYGGDMA